MKITTTIIGKGNENELFIKTLIAGLESSQNLAYLNGAEWHHLRVEVDPIWAGILGHDAQVLTLSDDDGI